MSATNGLTARIDSALLSVREVTRRLNKHLSGTLVPVLTGSRGSRASPPVAAPASAQAATVTAPHTTLADLIPCDDDPASLLAPWLATAGTETVTLCAHPADLLALLADPRLIPNGISDPRANLSISDEARTWVRRDNLSPVTGKHMLAPAGQPCVRLHPTDQRRVCPRPCPRPAARRPVHPPRPARTCRRAPPAPRRPTASS